VAGRLRDHQKLDILCGQIQHLMGSTRRDFQPFDPRFNIDGSDGPSQSQSRDGVYPAGSLWRLGCRGRARGGSAAILP